MRLSEFLLAITCLAISSYGQAQSSCGSVGDGCTDDDQCCGTLLCLPYDRYLMCANPPEQPDEDKEKDQATAANDAIEEEAVGDENCIIEHEDCWTDADCC